MAYLILMLFQSPLLRTLNSLYHRLVPTSLNVYVREKVIKTLRHAKKIENPITIYLTDQGMSS